MSTFAERLTHTGRVIVGTAYLIGSVIAISGVGFGLAAIAYGTFGYISELSQGDAPKLGPLPENHRELLLAGDASATKREAIEISEGRGTNLSNLDYADRVDIAGRLEGARWRLAEARADSNKAREQAIIRPLTAGAAWIGVGIAIYFSVWAMRWLATGRSSTLFSAIKRRR